MSTSGDSPPAGRASSVIVRGGSGSLLSRAWCRSGKVATLLVLGAVLAPPADAQTFDLFPVSGSTPSSITPGPDGALWFIERKAHQIGRITTSGVVTEFPIPAAAEQFPGSASQIVAGRDGNLWLSEGDLCFGGRIWRVSTQGVFRQFSIPDNLWPSAITAGPDGNVWFRVLNCGLSQPLDGKVGRITPSGAISLFSIPTRGSGAGTITSGPDGAIWFTETSTARIGRITVSGRVTEFPAGTALLPRNDDGSMVAGADGASWFTEYASRIGRITTSGVTTEFDLLNGSAGAITSGPDGALWFTEADGVISRMTPSGAITVFPIPTGISGGGSIATGPDGAIWFTGSSGIARMTIPQSCASDARTICLHDGRFQIQATWRVPSDGSTGFGTAIRLTNDTGYFWFFSSTNVEMLVKVVNGYGFNNSYWVFAGGLTNVEVTLTVTDTQTGAVKTYVNPAKTAFLPIQDTAAFGSCP